MMDFLKSFHSYDLKARVSPSLLTMLPAVATLLAWYPGLLTSNAGAATLTVINTCGLLFLLAELSRSQGQRAQRHLLKKWKVMPTTRILRHSDDALPVEVKARYHQHLATMLGSALPTAAEETADPAAADASYQSAIHWLMEQCRGSAHFLILNENTSYGFRRNLFSLKPAGILVCIVAIAAVCLVLWTRYPHASGFVWGELRATASTLQPVQAGALGLNLIALTGWLLVVRSSWVKEAGDLYARRLLAACETSQSAST